MYNNTSSRSSTSAYPLIPDILNRVSLHYGRNGNAVNGLALYVLVQLHHGTIDLTHPFQHSTTPTAMPKRSTTVFVILRAKKPQSAAPASTAPTRPTSPATARAPTTFQKRESSTLQRWSSTIDKRATTSSVKTTQTAACKMTLSTCTDSSSRKQKTCSKNASRPPEVVAKTTYTSLSARETTAAITSRRSNPASSRSAVSLGCSTRLRRTRVVFT